jgi:hypothetical protein
VRCECASFGALLLAFRKEYIACIFKNPVLIALLYDESPKNIRNVGNLSCKEAASHPRRHESLSNQSVVCNVHVLTTADAQRVNPE